MARPSSALLALEDGTIVVGRALGARGETFGEAVFNTAMAGYQEILTDPSYAGQVVVMTAPQIGNYGLNAEDPESARVRAAGFVVREAARRPSSWRAETSLHDALAAAGTVGIEGVDTRMLTLRIRRGGAMRCGITTEDTDAASFLRRVQEQPGMAGADLAHDVSTPQPYGAETVVGPASPGHGRVFGVVAYDFGLKRNLLRMLAGAGCEVTVVPARTAPAEVLGLDPDGVFLSNGPGDPAATAYGVEAAGEVLAAGVPTFGVCLGHQLMALALGATTSKLPFGHRGANHPVRDAETGRVLVPSHNHGFTVDPASLPGAGGLVPTHWNLNDGTLEGFRCLDRPAFAVQFHPEAAPGPHDAADLVHRFRRLMADAAA